MSGPSFVDELLSEWNTGEGPSTYASRRIGPYTFHAGKTSGRDYLHAMSASHSLMGWSGDQTYDKIKRMIQEGLARELSGQMSSLRSMVSSLREKINEPATDRRP